MKNHPDCIHYGKGGWCRFRKGKNIVIAYGTCSETFVKMRCSEIMRSCGGECKYYKCDYQQ